MGIVETQARLSEVCDYLAVRKELAGAVCECGVHLNANSQQTKGLSQCFPPHEGFVTEGPNERQWGLNGKQQNSGNRLLA